MRRFIQDPAQITVPDERTVVFDRGAPQPLLEAYLSSQYGPLVRNVARDDPPAISYVERQWTTILRAVIEGFAFNPINIGTFNVYTMSRATSRQSEPVGWLCGPHGLPSRLPGICPFAAYMKFAPNVRLCTPARSC